MAATLIFVHPTLSVNFTFQTAKQRGFKILTVTTSLEKTHLDMSIINQQSDAVFTGSDSPHKDLAQIQKIIKDRSFKVTAIINGIDASVYYADVLKKEILGAPIDLDASLVRLNKYAVNQALQKRGMVTIPSVEITCKQDLITKKEAIHKLGLPIIAKPSENTAAMSAVELVKTLDGLNLYLDQYLHKTNTYYSDNTIEKVILQKYIPTSQFDEFVIDIVSYEGKHYCAGLLQYRHELRESKYKIFRYCVPSVVEDLPAILPVVTYVKECLTALNVRDGFTHNEIFWDRDQQYYLIESNPRMAGAGVLEAYQNTYGYYPLPQYLDLLEHKPIVDIPKKRKSYSLTMFLYNLSKEGSYQIRIEDIPSFQQIITFPRHDKDDPHFYRHYTRAATVNACVLLDNPSKEALDRDIRTILQREAEGSLFV
ncbi:MAG: ATP-grasp domain-containing protein [Verrucomicrobia bacterium]|nr:ATP-grasp domain-containing protein [Verrucomicrobiota bacterium]MBU6445779.1 ATP-grasp domain-containing protein [Verrucomicrobiota bacterium]MDE3046816.1 ATP-grasp domain-containing protein [Verrucomicrobiota bacterium]